LVGIGKFVIIIKNYDNLIEIHSYGYQQGMIPPMAAGKKPKKQKIDGNQFIGQCPCYYIRIFIPITIVSK
jgi:hypothetical protein